MTTEAQTRTLQVGGAMSRRADIPFAVGILGILFVILVPLPTFLMDGLLIVNLALSLIILLTTTCVSRALEFNVYPSVLLMVTFYRLALNVATTRLILGYAGERQLAAAGSVVEAFADFVSGTNVVVGLVVFAVIVVVQFVVITRGTTRISEVAARFTLDAMPGKQMSIDGDLSAGLITKEEARRRRKEITQEADFFGAMDGASKFVRGEAVASIVITLTNIIGGLVIGTVYYSMEPRTAADVFARLTVGDGLVTQIPALMVSVATALLITKNSGSEGLGTDLSRQLLGNERVFFVAAGFLFILLPSGLPVGALLLGVLACVSTGLWLRDLKPEAAPDETPAPAAPVPVESPQEKVRSLLVLEPIELELGYRLVGLVDDLMARLGKVRERVALDLGLVVPPVKVTDNTRLQPGEYLIKLRGSVVGRGRVRPGRSLVLTEGESPVGIDGVPGVDPSTEKPGLWVDDSSAGAAARAGYLLRRIPEMVADHLDRNIRSHAAEILSREEASKLIADLRKRSPALVDELIPGIVKLGDVHKILQSLLREQVSVRNLEMILEALADHGETTRDPVELAEHARRAIARSICAPLVTRDGVLHAALLDPALEEFLQSSVEKSARGSRLAIEPEMAETLVDSVVGVLSRLETERYAPVLVASGMIRAHLRALLARKVPLASILAYEEVGDEFRLEVHGSVALEKVSLN